MAIDTYLIVPTGSRALAEELLRDHPDLEDEAQLGEDFVALLQDERFTRVQRDPELWGETYLDLIPPACRTRLDKRGLLVVPDMGQSFDGVSFEEVAAERGATWLPLKPARASRRAKRVLLVHLSPNRQARLLRDPALAREIVSARADQPVPDALELDAVWVELQQLLVDHQKRSGAVDARSEAIAPKKGLPLYEDKTIDAALLVRAEQARATAEWVLALPADLAAHQPRPAGGKQGKAGRPRDARVLDAALARLKAFYKLVHQQGCAILAIRFRG